MSIDLHLHLITNVFTSFDHKQFVKSIIARENLFHTCYNTPSIWIGTYSPWYDESGINDKFLPRVVYDLYKDNILIINQELINKIIRAYAQNQPCKNIRYKVNSRRRIIGFLINSIGKESFVINW